MENAVLISLSRQMALRRNFDVVANNIANINTVGYKGDTLKFDEYVMPAARDNSFPAQDQKLSYVIDRATITSLAAGSFNTTGAELDVALQGDGFLAVQTEKGERYTRAGSLSRNSQGELVTSAGDKILGEGGPIVITPQDGRVSIARDGTIGTDQGVRGRLKILSFKPDDLQKEGNTLFKAARAGAPDRTTAVVQGAVEQSNVQPVLEMSRMIEVNRAYQTLSQMMERTNELRQTAIQRLAQINA